MQDEFNVFKFDFDLPGLIAELLKKNKKRDLAELNNLIEKLAIIVEFGQLRSIFHREMLLELITGLKANNMLPDNLLNRLSDIAKEYRQNANKFLKENDAKFNIPKNSSK